MQNKLFAWILVVGLLGMLIHPGCKKKSTEPEGKIHKDYINKDETWRAADNPHIIEGDIFVGWETDATLTIEPGVIVRFKAGAWLVIASHGSFIANGTEEKPIKFTSNGTSPRAGDWAGIYFNTDEPRHSILNNCIIEYGGTRVLPNLYVHCKSATITNCTIRNGKTSGMEVYKVDDSLVFSGNLVTKNGESGIIVSRVKSFICTENIVSQNGGSGINFGEVASLTFAGNVVTQNGSYPIITSSLESLFKFSKDNYFCCILKFKRSGLDVGSSGLGTLVAKGTTEEPIIFTSAYSPSEPGDWLSLAFSGGTQNSILSNCVIEYDDFTNIFIRGGASPTITNNIIRNSNGWGIYIESGSPIIENNTFSNNPYGDIGP